MVLAVSVLLLLHSLPVAKALTARRAGTSGLRGHNPAQAEALSFLSIHQHANTEYRPRYVEYGNAQFTTFNNLTTACQACVTFWPAKEDGGRFHSKLYEDNATGGVWQRSCRAGTCNFRDPQTEPVGGVEGRDLGEGKSCITRDPVPWFTDCEPVLLESTHTVHDATRYCSYREQIFIPPPKETVSRFAGKPEAWARIGGKQEKCMKLIEREGAALFNEKSMSMCDSDLPALSGCCETVHSALACVAETSFTRANVTKQDVFATFTAEGTGMLQLFEKYCVPLCQNSKETFCTTYPGADACKNPKSCTDCTSLGGLWCPKLESCHCPSKHPPCLATPITTPLKCWEANQKSLGGGNKLQKESEMVYGAGAGGGAAGAGSVSEPACKYTEMARNWKIRGEEVKTDSVF